MAEFVEKPEREVAEEYLASGVHLWNTGLFVWRVADLLDGLERHAPEFRELIPVLREGGTEEFFRLAPTISIDEALLERSDRVGVVRATFAWDDVGAWDAVLRTRPADAAGNVLLGEATRWIRATRLYADDGPVVAFGVEELVVVRTGRRDLRGRPRPRAGAQAAAGAAPGGLRTLARHEVRECGSA